MPVTVAQGTSAVPMAVEDTGVVATVAAEEMADVEMRVVGTAVVESRVEDLAVVPTPAAVTGMAEVIGMAEVTRMAEALVIAVLVAIQPVLTVTGLEEEDGEKTPVVAPTAVVARVTAALSDVTTRAVANSAVTRKTVQVCQPMDGETRVSIPHLRCTVNSVGNAVTRHQEIPWWAVVRVGAAGM